MQSRERSVRAAVPQKTKQISQPEMATNQMSAAMPQPLQELLPDAQTEASGEAHSGPIGGSLLWANRRQSTRAYRGIYIYIRNI